MEKKYGWGWGQMSASTFSSVWDPWMGVGLQLSLTKQHCRLEEHKACFFYRQENWLSFVDELVKKVYRQTETRRKKLIRTQWRGSWRVEWSEMTSKNKTRLKDRKHLLVSANSAEGFMTFSSSSSSRPKKQNKNQLSPVQW